MLCLLAAIGFGSLSVSQAFASPPSLVWSGHSTTSEDWSFPANWEGEVAPTASMAIGTLTFPRLTSNACLNETGASPCYFSYNDLSGLSTESIHIDDANDYAIGGEPVALGAGGLTATPATSGSAGDILELPLQLTASQKWSIAQNIGGSEGENGVLLAAPVTGSGKALTVELSEGPAFYLANNTEVGPVTLAGANPGEAGVFNGFVGLLEGELNSTNGQPVDLNHLFFIGDGSLGALSTDESEFYVGSGGKPTGSIHVTSATLDPASEVTFEIAGSGSTLQEDYSQLASNGPIELAGSKVAIKVSPAKKGQSCPVLTAGRTYTFVTTTATLSGEFSNAPEHGAEIPITFAAACTQLSQKLRVSYHESGATETVTGTVEAAAHEQQEAKELQEAKERQEAIELQEAKERQEANERQEAKEHQEATERQKAKELQEAREALAKQTAEAAAKKKHEEELAANTGSQGVQSFHETASPVVPDVELVSATLQASPSGAVTMRVTCPSGESACIGTVTLRTVKAFGKSAAVTARANTAIVTLAAGTFTVAGGKVSSVLLHLSANARKLLEHLHFLDVRVTIAAHDRSGALHTTQALAILHPPKAKRKQG